MMYVYDVYDVYDIGMGMTYIMIMIGVKYFCFVNL